jgi:ketosteroid isomerase-like protein
VPRRRLLTALLVGAVAACAAAALSLRSSPDLVSARGAALTEQDVRDAAADFASAVGAEDSAALSRVLTRDVQRVFPTDTQRGRDAVLAAYRNQFRANRITGYRLSDLDVAGGRAGRASGRYELSRAGRGDTGGRIVLGIARERGRPKVALIAADPD